MSPNPKKIKELMKYLDYCKKNYIVPDLGLDDIEIITRSLALNLAVMLLNEQKRKM